jgi:hypothetical protein
VKRYSTVAGGRRKLALVGLWSLLVLFFSTRTEVRGAQWCAWGLLAPVIVWIDRHLPLERDALFRRFLFHVPLTKHRPAKALVLSSELCSEPEGV